jgi:hypothetical protein
MKVVTVIKLDIQSAGVPTTQMTKILRLFLKLKKNDHLPLETLPLAVNRSLRSLSNKMQIRT